MRALFSWFVATPYIYYSIALSSLLAFGVSAIVDSERAPRKWTSEWLFLALAGCTVLVWRWPSMLWPQPLNIDEGQFAASALRATYDFAPFRGFDGTTSGPLNCLILALPALFGAPITFFSTRLIAYVLLMVAIYELYFIAKWTHGASTARLSIVPVVAFLGLTWQWVFLHYSSECFPILLTTTGMAAGTYLATGIRPPGGRLAACALGGLFVGSAGFAKLQAAPIALAALVFMAGAIFLKRGRPRKERWIEALTTAAAFSLLPGAIAISVLGTGEWNDAVISYVKASVVYVRSGTTVGFSFFFGTAVTYTTFAVTSLIVIVTGTVALIGRWRFTKRSAIIALCALCFLAVCLAVIVVARHDYPHYLLFSVLPLSYCVATILGFIREAQLWKGKEDLLSSLIAAGFLVPALSLSMAIPSPFLGRLRDVLLRGRPDIASYLPFRHSAAHSYLPFQHTGAQVEAIRKYAAPGSRVTIWGYMPQYYVQTQTIPASRDAITEAQLTPGPYREYFRERFMSDLQDLPPSVFIDAAAPGSFWITDRATQGFEVFPALAAFIDANYLLKEDVEGVRIFVLKERKTPAAVPDKKSPGNTP